MWERESSDRGQLLHSTECCHHGDPLYCYWAPASTLTDRCIHITLCLLHLASLQELDKLPPALQTSFDSLYALKGILNNQITCSEEEYEIYPKFATLSLLQAVEGFLDMCLTRAYNFLHLSIQELLAARHISKLPSDTQINIVRGLLDHPRFAGVIRFYAGITRLRTPGIEGIIRDMVQRFKQDSVSSSFSKKIIRQ